MAVAFPETVEQTGAAFGEAPGEGTHTGTAGKRKQRDKQQTHRKDLRALFHKSKQPFADVND